MIEFYLGLFISEGGEKKRGEGVKGAFVGFWWGREEGRKNWGEEEEEEESGRREVGFCF